VPAETHWSRSERSHATSHGRAPGPLSQPAITLSHNPPTTLNEVRINLECRCVLTNRTTGKQATYGLGAQCQAEQVGAASRCLELTVTYTKERVQFGRPIGSFQALKHRMADLYVKVQTAGAVVDEGVENPSSTTAALAHIAATEAFRDVAAEAVQMHGGIAITWEHDIQLYFKRSHGSSQLLGQPADYLRRLEPDALSTPSEAQ